MTPKNPSILTALGINLHAVGDLALLKAATTKAELDKLLPITASMPVDERTMHPYGKLSGGASLALAECLAGYASRLICAEHEFPAGMQVSANHTAGASKGETLFASATLIHKGAKTHIWNIDINSDSGKLISSVRVSNLIITNQS